MAQPKGVIPSREAWEQIVGTVQHVGRHQPRRKARRMPRRRNVGSAGGDCPEVHEITTTGSPSAGTATLTYVLDGVSDTVTINWDDTATEVKTAMETHSNVTAGDVVVTGGPLPAVAVYIRFAADLANLSMPLPSIADSITGGDLRLRKATSYDWEA